MGCGTLPAPYPRIKKAGGLEIYIVDDETNEPISNIAVFHSLEKAMPKWILEVDYTTIHEGIFISDENGKIIIPNKHVFLWVFHVLTGEYLYININVNDDYLKNRQEFFDSPSKDFNRKYTLYKSDLLGEYFLVSRIIRNHVHFYNRNYYPSAIYLWEDMESKIIRQEKDFGEHQEDAKLAFVEYPVGSPRKKIRRIIVKLVRYHDLENNEN